MPVTSWIIDVWTLSLGGMFYTLCFSLSHVVWAFLWVPCFWIPKMFYILTDLMSTLWTSGPFSYKKWKTNISTFFLFRLFPSNQRTMPQLHVLSHMTATITSLQSHDLYTIRHCNVFPNPYFFWVALAYLDGKLHSSTTQSDIPKHEEKDSYP